MKERRATYYVVTINNRQVYRGTSYISAKSHFDHGKKISKKVSLTGIRR